MLLTTTVKIVPSLPSILKRRAGIAPDKGELVLSKRRISLTPINQYKHILLFSSQYMGEPCWLFPVATQDSQLGVLPNRLLSISWSLCRQVQGKESTFPCRTIDHGCIHTDVFLWYIFQHTGCCPCTAGIFSSIRFGQPDQRISMVESALIKWEQSWPGLQWVPLSEKSQVQSLAACCMKSMAILHF